LNDENEWVRTAAVNSPHFGPQHMDKALNDKDMNVRDAAKSRQAELKQKGLIKNLQQIRDLVKAIKAGTIRSEEE
jgi:hypothetical protein